MRFSVVFVAIIIPFFLFLVQEVHSQITVSNQRGPVPPPQLIVCSFSDSMPNGHRKPNRETVMQNGYRKTEPDREMVFTVVEQQPEFPGGTKALSAFLKANVRLPDEARKAGVKGRVFASFVIEKDGTISSPMILKGLGFGCDEEALRVIALMPRWEPGKQSGAVLRVKYNLPIAFGLD
jgi:hypothetical protein